MSPNNILFGSYSPSVCCNTVAHPSLHLLLDVLHHFGHPVHFGCGCSQLSPGLPTVVRHKEANPLTLKPLYKSNIKHCHNTRCSPSLAIHCFHIPLRECKTIAVTMVNFLL